VRADSDTDLAAGHDGADGMPTGDGGGESSVIDDQEYSHTRRLRAIHNAHDRVLKVRNAVDDRTISGQLDDFHARRYYRGAVESFVMEIMPVLESNEIGFREDYAEGVELGTLTITPPEGLVGFARQHIRRLPPGAEVPTADEIHVEGVQSVLDVPSPIRRTFSVPVARRHDVEVVTRVVEQELSRDILDSCVQYGMRALEEASIGLNVGTGRPRNNAGTGDGEWPWETDKVLPHEIHDAIESGDLSRDELEELLEAAE